MEFLILTVGVGMAMYTIPNCVKGLKKCKELEDKIKAYYDNKI